MFPALAVDDTRLEGVTIIGNYDSEGLDSDKMNIDINQEPVDEPIVENEEAIDNTIPNFETLLPESPQPQEASFDLVHFNNFSHNFDSKYTSLGRYDFQPPDDHVDSKPEQDVSRRDTVPYLGILDMKTSSPDNDMDSGKSTLSSAPNISH